jgi:protein gp37
MNKTKIEYLDFTWNPIAMRCTPVSDGCRNCWHLAMAKRLTKNPTIPKDEREAYAGGCPVLRNLEPLSSLKKPSRIGVQFMGDLFHEKVPKYFIVSIWMMMLSANRHKYFVLTKRPQRMLDLVSVMFKDIFTKEPATKTANHIWLGVSIEDQKTADEQIPILLQIPAAKRFVSCEPLLSEIDLFVAFGGHDQGLKMTESLDWVICGAETGPGARPLHPDWVKSLRDQCQAAGVPFFFKSWGEWTDLTPDKVYLQYKFDDGLLMHRVGKKKSGHLLDCKEWRQFPK